MAGSSSARDRPKRKAMCRSVWLQRQRKRAKTDHNGSRVSLATTKSPPCQQGHISEIAENAVSKLELDKLPEDLVHHIYSLMPLRDAARAACVSRRFLCSWRQFPNLTFSWETIGFNEDAINNRGKKLADRIQHIIRNHSGSGVKTLNLQAHHCGYNTITANQLDIWLKATVKSGIKELTLKAPRHSRQELRMPCTLTVFSFPCSLLSCAAGSLQSLSLSYCSFRPTPIIGCLRMLKSVNLTSVRITEEELGCFFSRTISLEKLDLFKCDEITLLRIPYHLQQLRMLQVFRCTRVQSIEIHASKVNTFFFTGRPIKILISNPSQLKRMSMRGACCSPGMFQYAPTDLQTLTLSFSKETLKMPASPHKFLNLRHLKCSSSFAFQCFDFLSLIPFLYACPALETLCLMVGQHYYARKDSILERSDSDSPNIRQIPEFHHQSLKKVSITGFCAAESLIELTCQILESCSSLERLVLDTIAGYFYPGRCRYMDKIGVMEALKGVEAIKRYVKGKVPSSVKLEVLEPCGQCHISIL